jgi:hypothetical protein
MKDEITYAETVEILEDFVRLGLCNIKRGKTQVDDIYKISDFGIWLADTNRFREYDDIPERRAELRGMFEKESNK